MFLRVDTQFAENGTIITVTNVEEGNSETKNFVFPKTGDALKFAGEIYREFFKINAEKNG